jgi:ABC-type branched-subunit amino acid transport system ATPase component/ABC-type branched-subunit amino acid transport system permease subunit
MSDAKSVLRYEPSADGGGSRISVRQFVWPIVAYAALLGILAILRDPYWTRIIALIGFWTLVGTSWNLIGGYAGQPSFGHSAFVGIGAYATVILLNAGVAPWAGIPCAVAIACVAAALIGYPTLRLRDVYFALATLVYPLILGLIVTYFELQEVLVPTHPEAQFLYMSWVDPRWFAALFGLIVLLVWFGLTLVEGSRYRLVMEAIRQDEETARSAGINTPRVKLVCFVASAALAALAGGIYIQLIFVVTPNVLSFDLSIQAILIALVGGIGRRAGGLIGAAILVPIVNAAESLFGATSGGSQFAYGIALMAVVIAMPRGLIDQAERLLRSATKGAAPTTPVSGVASALRVVEGSRALDRSPLLDGRGLGKSYGGVVALEEIDIIVARGEFVGLVGPNGAGKSTLFDLLTGYQRPNAGRVLIAGADVTRLPTYEIARRGVRRTFQSARPFGRLSVLENALIGSAASSRATPEQAASARGALAAVGLLAYQHAAASSLTPSQLRLLEVARAIASGPDLLLLDEPLAGLTAAETESLLRVLHDLNEKGLAILIVDHNIGSVARAVSRLIVIDRGAMIANDAPERVMRDQRVVGAYLGAGANAA